MHLESHKRSFVKAISYRLLGTLITGSVTFFITGRLAIALTITACDFALKMAIYFFHERLWEKIPFGKYEPAPIVVWFTGLSGAGKTTLSENLVQHLKSRGLKVEHLDGDRIREMLPDVGFSPEQRKDHIRRVGLLASYLQKHGISVVTSLISPYDDSRQFARKQCTNFVEVYVSTPLEECERRDVKGLYTRARRGEIKNFTGIDAPYEAPIRPEISVNTLKETVTESMRVITSYLDPFLKGGSSALS